MGQSSNLSLALGLGLFVIAAAAVIVAPDPGLAVKASPPTVTCTGPCQACLEIEGGAAGGDRCVKCGVDPACIGGDPGLRSELTEMLNVHNERRAQHGVPALIWSAALATGAQAWADACTNSHSSGGSVYGENLAFFSPGQSPRNTFENSWYCEIKWYDFKNPKVVGGFKNKCDPPVNAHFTQIVWKATQQLGCGLAACTIGSETGTYWVCRYSPPGNWNVDLPGVLAANVPPPGAIPQTQSTGAKPRPPSVDTKLPTDVIVRQKPSGPIQENLKYKDRVLNNRIGVEATQGARPAGEAAPSTQPDITVDLDVEVYDEPGGNGKVIGELKAGAQNVYLGEPCRPDNWCNITGNVPTGNGWVWSGPGYESLKF